MEYKINEDLVFREEENTFFSLDNMEIYELNDVVMELIKQLQNQKFTIEEFNNAYDSLDDVDPQYKEVLFIQMSELSIIKEVK